MPAKNPSIVGTPALADETLLPVAKANEAFPVEVSQKWVETMIHKGTRGIRLESILIGHRRYTSKEAIRRFIVATQGTPKPKTTTHPPLQQRMSEEERKKARKRLGIAEPGSTPLPAEYAAVQKHMEEASIRFA